MSVRIQVGNLDESVGERELAGLFAPYGAVASARVATHSHTGRGTGVGFVDMGSEAAGAAAVAALHGRVHLGRPLSVSRGPAGLPARAGTQDMFGPMNMAGEDERPERAPELRGLAGAENDA